VWAGVFDDQFGVTLVQVALAIPLLVAVALAFHLVDHWPLRSAGLQTGAGGGASSVRRSPLLSAGVMPGIGLGGFLDGIVPHMLLQGHHLIAERLPLRDFASLVIPMFPDGVFKGGMWSIILIGLGLLWRAGRIPQGEWNGRILTGLC